MPALEMASRVWMGTSHCQEVLLPSNPQSLLLHFSPFLLGCISAEGRDVFLSRPMTWLVGLCFWL